MSRTQLLEIYTIRLILLTRATTVMEMGLAHQRFDVRDFFLNDLLVVARRLCGDIAQVSLADSRS